MSGPTFRPLSNKTPTPPKGSPGRRQYMLKAGRLKVFKVFKVPKVLKVPKDLRPLKPKAYSPFSSTQV